MFGLTDNKSKSKTTAKDKVDFSAVKIAIMDIHHALDVIDLVNKALVAPKPENTDDMHQISAVVHDDSTLTLYFYNGDPELIYAEKSETE